MMWIYTSCLFSIIMNGSLIALVLYLDDDNNQFNNYFCVISSATVVVFTIIQIVARYKIPKSIYIQQLNTILLVIGIVILIFTAIIQISNLLLDQNGSGKMPIFNPHNKTWYTIRKCCIIIQYANAIFLIIQQLLIMRFMKKRSQILTRPLTQTDATRIVISVQEDKSDQKDIQNTITQTNALYFSSSKYRTPNQRFRSRSTHHTMDKTFYLNQSLDASKSDMDYKKNQKVFLGPLFTKPILDALIDGDPQPYLKSILLCESLKKGFSIELSLAVDNNDLSRLEYLLPLTADIMFGIRQLDFAVFYYDQSRILFTYTKKHNKKARSLIGISNACQELKMYKESLIFLKKALQYAWTSNEHELTIYEKMSLIYFYQGKLQESLYFHERGTLGVYENDESPLKQFGIESLKVYLNKVQFSFNSIQPLLLSYLNLPTLSLQELPSQTEFTLRGGAKDVLIMPTSELIPKLLKHLEFQQTINTPRYQQIQTYEPNTTQTFKRRRNKPYIHKYDINDQTLYKLPLDKLIDKRVKNPPKLIDYQSKLASILRFRGSEKSMQPIYLNHFQKEQELYSNKALVLRRIKKIILDQ
ncbi:hypothetical protein pb186bvf_017225 [Paramecium bursaria]